MRFKKILGTQQPHDLVVMCFGFFLIGLDLIFLNRLPYWSLLITVNVVVIIFVAGISYFSYHYKSKFLHIVHNWYIAPMILLTFKQLYFMIAPIHGRDYDDVLIGIDRWIFGADPTVWLCNIATPWLTEIVQIAYSSFYFLFIIVGFEFYRKKDMDKFNHAAFLIIYGFYLSYVGYFFLPAVGPRFTLHDFFSLDTELPGIFTTKFLREFVNLGESIGRNTPKPSEIVQRDVFPSGHTQLTLLLMYITLKYKMKVKYFIWVIGILLIFGTVYLRYHYVIDLIAGAAFTALTVWSGKYIYSHWNSSKEKKLS
jgi:membrane-associated phospholipid phosphatase